MRKVITKSENRFLIPKEPEHFLKYKLQRRIEKYRYSVFLLKLFIYQLELLV